MLYYNSFCCTTTWVSYMYTYILPFSASFPPQPQPAPLGPHRARSQGAELPLLYYSFPPANSFTYDSVYCWCYSLSLSHPLLPHPVFTSLFSMSVSLFVVVQSLRCVQLFETSWTVHARLLCPPLSPRIYPSSCPLSWWCHLTISSSATLFSCSQPFSASGSFPMSWLFTSGGQIIRASTAASVLPKSIQGWFPLGLIGLILLFKGLSRVFSNTTVQKHQFFGTQPYLWSNTLSVHDY